MNAECGAMEYLVIYIHIIYMLYKNIHILSSAGGENENESESDGNCEHTNSECVYVKLNFFSSFPDKNQIIKLGLGSVLAFYFFRRFNTCAIVITRRFSTNHGH